jgi:glycosyltransferase involved in cell wall biosynthesis
MNSSISVIIPAFNGAAFIGDALRSVFAQTLAPLEIVVVDDASRDGTLDIVSTFVPYSPVPLKVIRLPRNTGGPARPMNVGIAAAAGEFFSVLDQDDLYVPDTLHQWMSASWNSDRADVGLISSDFVSFDERGTDTVSFFDRVAFVREYFRKAVPYSVLWLPPEEAFNAYCFQRCIAFKGLFSKRVWKQIGGFDESLRSVGDMDFVSRVARRYAIGMIDQILVKVRVHDKNLSRNEEVSTPEVIRVLRRMHSQCRSRGCRQRLRGRMHKELCDLAYHLRKTRHCSKALVAFCRLTVPALMGR